MSETIIPFPNLVNGVRPAAATRGGAEEPRALRLLERSFGDLRTTAELVRRAQEAMDGGDVREMEEIRDILADRIAARRRAGFRGIGRAADGAGP